MKLTILIIAVLFSGVCFGQGGASQGPPVFIPVDSADIKVISIKEFTNYLARIDNTIKKQFTIAEEARYKAIFKELQAIYEEADRKRKQK